MIKITSQNQAFDLEFNSTAGTEGTLNGEAFSLNKEEIYPDSFVVTRNGKEYHVQLVKADWEDKTLLIRVNGLKHELVLKDKFDLLLEKMGLAGMTVKKVTDVKAPMPGLVLETRVQPGDDVAKGDALFVLEAMKMENIIKSPAEGKVKAIKVEQGAAVEKNAVLLTFE